MQDEIIKFVQQNGRIAPLPIIILASVLMPSNCIRAIDESPLPTQLRKIRVLAQTENAAQVKVFETQAPAYRQLQQALIAQNKPTAALEISERSRNRAFVDLLATRIDAANVSPPTSEEIKQIAKQQNATIIEYSIITDELNVAGKRQNRESELFIWVIKPTGEVTFRSVDLKPLWQQQKTSLADLVGSTLQAIGGSSSSDRTRSGVDKGLHKLHQLLIQPIADVLPTNPSERVIFIPQGALFLVPFPALQDNSGKYLIEQHAISTAPSIQALDLLYQQRQRIAGVAKDVLVVGNPTMPSVPPKLGEPPQQLSPLPGAEQEAKAIANIFNTQPLTGKEATKSAVLEQMNKARIVHLATHMLIDDVWGLGSAIALAPSSTDNGLLTTEEVINLKLNAELVVLSAGDTARGRIAGDGVIGLSRAFMTAGVPSVVATLWDIQDEPPTLLMTEFYQNLQQNLDKSQALQKAMLAMKKKYPNPRDWAAFTLIGVL